MDTKLFRKNLLILFVYSACYRIWLSIIGNDYGAVVPLLLMAIGVGVHSVILLSFAIDRRSRDHALAAVAVALIGFGACTFEMPI
jgi:hypothetical protein